MRIIYTSKFSREYKKLTNNIKDIAEEKAPCLPKSKAIGLQTAVQGA